VSRIRCGIFFSDQSAKEDRKLTHASEPRRRFARKLRPLFSTTPTGVHNNCIDSAPCRSSPIGIGSQKASEMVLG
jgi:hypothetical protein